MRIEPYEIAIPQAQVDDLRERLRLTRLPDALDGVGWGWGTDPEFLRDAIAHWADGFDWRAQEARLNAVPQFTARLDRGDVHFLHVVGAGPRTMPLLLSHGWPGSFAEMMAVIPLLTTHNQLTDELGLTFDLVVPSLPGFGFSSRPQRPGASPAVVAEMFHELMLGLGYRTYGVQGGDLGAGISMRLGLEHPEAVIGVHTNFPSFGYDGAGLAPDKEASRAADARRAAWLKEEGGYSHLHATRPQTVGAALNDSPAGLAAWILEKFHAWSDRGGSDAMPFDLDELLTTVSIYWFTETITSSMRIYRESAADPLVLSADRRIGVPFGVAAFPFELPTQPRERVEQVTDLVRWADMPSGGHFAALEEPALLAREVLTFFAEVLEARSSTVGG
ncbi:MAG: epoxide hydrolase family protein [Aeromicrobium sp.]